MAEISTILRILDFWFGPAGTPARGRRREVWFAPDPRFDDEIRTRFQPSVEQALANGFADWSDTAYGCLALCLLLDQFPRNLFRGSPRAFAGDVRARAIADDAIARMFDRQLLPVERVFLYLPFEHSEDIGDQRRSVALFAALAATEDGAEWLAYAEAHLRVIEQFGRFPHRNAALGRPSTPEETEYLSKPDAGF